MHRPIMIDGTLEIDPLRGVISFHTNNPKIIQKMGTVTMLKVMELPIPIPKWEQIVIMLPNKTDKNLIVSYNSEEET